MTPLELLLGRSLHNNLKSQAENFVTVTDENEATDFGVTADVGDVVRTTSWVPEDNTVHHLNNELRTRLQLLLFDIHLTKSIVIVFLRNGHTEMAYNFVNIRNFSIWCFVSYS